MRFINSIVLLFWAYLFLTFFPISSFAQLDKNSCQEILESLKISEFRQIEIITHVLTTDSSVQKPTICLLSPFVEFVFKENYVIIENKRNPTTLYLPYNRIKFITTLEPTGIFSNGKTIEIHLMD